MKKQSLSSVFTTGKRIVLSSFFICFFVFSINIASAQNVGIDVDPPLSKLHVNGGILATGEVGNTPVSGYGTRFMWIPAKNALRAGRVEGPLSNYWDDGNIGLFSVAMGWNTKASSETTIAIGKDSQATGQRSITLGTNNLSSGLNAVTIGGGNQATNGYTIAIGGGCQASGYNGIAIGDHAFSIGNYSRSIGLQTTAQSYCSFTTGRYNLINGTTDAWVETDPLFIIGNGSGSSDRNNALIVYKNGNTEIDGDLDITGAFTGDGSGLTNLPGDGDWTTNGNYVYNSTDSIGIGTSAPLSKLHVNEGGLLITGTTGSTIVSGSGTRLMWIPAKKAFRAGAVTGIQWDDSQIANYSVSFGLDVVSDGTYSFATGNWSQASGLASAAIGDHTVSTGDYSFSSGQNNHSVGDMSVTLGYNNNAYGDYSIALGNQTWAEAYNSFVIGRHNIHSGSQTSWVSTDPLFVIGNGADIFNHNNALTVYKNGNTEIDGALDITGILTGDGSGLTNLPGDGDWTISNDSLFRIVGIDTLVTIADNGNLEISGTFSGDGSGLINLPDDGDWTISGSDMYASISGNIGIGTTTPSTSLHIKSGNWDDHLAIERTGNPIGHISLGNNNMVFWVGTGTGMYINSTGDVGIGNIPSSSKLFVDGNLGLQNGTSVNEFSTDGTLTGDSDEAVPTERAVKSYVDNMAYVPVGSIIAWAKNIGPAPLSLSENFVECNGQVLDNDESPLDGLTIPNLNGNGGADTRFLRGATASGGSGGSDSHSHSVNGTVDESTSMMMVESGTTAQINQGDHQHDMNFNTGSTSSLPPYYEIVWIMRVK